MADWTRETPWKQGSLISNVILDELGLAEDPNQLGVVISHDCDLANENLSVEPHVELIVASRLDEADGNCQYAKNPRRLHLTWTGQEQAPSLVLDMKVLNKKQVEKNVLSHYEPLGEFELPLTEKRILQSWLAARYKRQALPDSLQMRLGEIFKLLEKQGKRSSEGILGYWISFDPQEETTPEEPYDFILNIIYTIDIEGADKIAESIRQTVEERFEGLVKKQGHGEVHLVGCNSYSEEEFTVHDMRTHIEYRLEHISHKAHPKDSQID